MVRVVTLFAHTRRFETDARSTSRRHSARATPRTTRDAEDTRAINRARVERRRAIVAASAARGIALRRFDLINSNEETVRTTRRRARTREREDARTRGREDDDDADVDARARGGTSERGAAGRRGDDARGDDARALRRSRRRRAARGGGTRAETGGDGAV